MCDASLLYILLCPVCLPRTPSTIHVRMSASTIWWLSAHARCMCRVVGRQGTKVWVANAVAEESAARVIIIQDHILCPEGLLPQDSQWVYVTQQPPPGAVYLNARRVVLVLACARILSRFSIQICCFCCVDACFPTGGHGKAHVFLGAVQKRPPKPCPVAVSVCVCAPTTTRDHHPPPPSKGDRGPSGMGHASRRLLVPPRVRARGDSDGATRQLLLPPKSRPCPACGGSGGPGGRQQRWRGLRHGGPHGPRPQDPDLLDFAEGGRSPQVPLQPRPRDRQVLPSVPLHCHNTACFFRVHCHVKT